MMTKISIGATIITRIGEWSARLGRGRASPATAA